LFHAYHKFFQLMIEEILLNKVITNSLECQFFSNISTSWYYNMQGIQEQPMSTTLVQNITNDNGEQNF
jgi:hypothetical protein